MDSSQLFSSSSNTISNPITEVNRSSSGDGSARRRIREMESLSLDIRKYPRNLFQSFLSTDPNTDHLHHHHHHQGAISTMKEQGAEEEVELNLGLSLGGRFGVDKSHKRLTRSSSIAGTVPLIREEETVAPPPAAVTALVRTSSLPTETEEWRRRKELQTLKRMEAKRRRSEKQRNLKECLSISGDKGGEDREKGGVVSDSMMSLSFRGRLERERQHLGFPCNFNYPSSSIAGLGSAGQGIGGDRREIDVVRVKGKRGIFSSLHGLSVQQRGSQGSVESQGGGSSTGGSDPESRAHQGSGSFREVRSPASIQSLWEISSQEIAPRSSCRPKSVDSPTRSQPKPEPEDKNNKRRESGGVEDMPCVFTIGDGPKGRKVEGILYKYGKGEEVRIMCVCHGSFFSPAEFVKHAGGRNVEHPLRHIVVNPCSSFQ